MSFDGKYHQELNEGDSLHVTMSIYPVPSICATDQIQDWFDSLGECLHWNVRKQQKNFETDLASLDSQEVAAALEDDKANA
jgi:NAD+ kinase